MAMIPSGVASSHAVCRSSARHTEAERPLGALLIQRSKVAHTKGFRAIPSLVGRDVFGKDRGGVRFATSQRAAPLSSVLYPRRHVLPMLRWRQMLTVVIRRG